MTWIKRGPAYLVAGNTDASERSEPQTQVAIEAGRSEPPPTVLTLVSREKMRSVAIGKRSEVNKSRMASTFLS